MNIKIYSYDRMDYKHASYFDCTLDEIRETIKRSQQVEFSINLDKFEAKVNIEHSMVELCLCPLVGLEAGISSTRTYTECFYRLRTGIRFLHPAQPSSRKNNPPITIGKKFIRLQS